MTVYIEKSDLYKKQDGTDNSKADPGYVQAKHRQLYFEATPTHDALGVGSLVKLCVLPANARVVNWKILIPSTGTIGIFKLGNEASADAVEGADDDAFGSGYDAGGQAVLCVPAATGNAGLFKKYSSPVIVELNATEATDTGTGSTFKGYIEYVID